MSIVMIMHWPEVTPELYDEARDRVGWETDAPIGGRGHAAWFEDDGLHAVDVWESAEAFNTFVNERLMPVVKGELAIAGEPDVRILAAHRQFVPEAITA